MYTKQEFEISEIKSNWLEVIFLYWKVTHKFTIDLNCNVSLDLET